MLQSMRDLGKNWIFKTLMGLLVVSFSIWGIGDMFRGNSQQRAVAEVGHEDISVQALQNEFQRTVKQARANFGPGFTVQQAHAMGLLDKTLSLMIQRSLFDQDLAKIGIQVTEKAVLNRLANMAQFKTPEGRFNERLFQNLLSQNGLNEQTFFQNERQEEGRNILFEALMANRTTPDLMVNQMAQAMGQRRVFEILTIANNSSETVKTPTEEELKAFHEQNGKLFTAPEYRSLTILKLASADIVKDIAVSDEAIQKYYDTKRDTLAEPELRDLVQVVLQDEEKAKSLSDAAKAFGDLTKAAKNQGYSAIPISKADKSNAALGDLYNTLFDMADHDVSAPIHSPMGWHVVQVIKTYPAHIPSFDEIKGKLASTLKQEQAIESVTRTVNQLDDSLAAGQSFEDIADTLHLRLIKMQPVDAKGLLENGSAPAEFPAKDEILKTAFAQSNDEVSAVMEDRSSDMGNYVVVRTDDIIPAHVRSIGEVHDKVVAAWKKNRQSAMIQEEADQIAASVRDGKALSSFASRAGMGFRMSQPLSPMGETDKAIPQNVVEKLLRLKKGDVITASGEGEHLVLRLAAVKELDPTNAANTKNQVKDKLLNDRPSALIEMYGKYLANTHTVKINQKILNYERRQEN